MARAGPASGRAESNTWLSVCFWRFSVLARVGKLGSGARDEEGCSGTSQQSIWCVVGQRHGRQRPPAVASATTGRRWAVPATCSGGRRRSVSTVEVVVTWWGRKSVAAAGRHKRRQSPHHVANKVSSGQQALSIAYMKVNHRAARLPSLASCQLGKLNSQPHKPANRWLTAGMRVALSGARGPGSRHGLQRMAAGVSTEHFEGRTASRQEGLGVGRRWAG